ncbi:MAG TPA: hypothetical protein ENJ44_06680, partial [Oceanospirillales bacterium]|nr:hypothetical protein [Oceanospirillales bacterium]
MRTKSILFILNLIICFNLWAQQISGTVIDSATNNPIANAMITEYGTTNQVFTANDGSYSINVSGNNIELVGAKKGYYYASTTSNSPANNVTIALDSVPTADNPNYAIRPPTECG